MRAVMNAEEEDGLPRSDLLLPGLSSRDGVRQSISSSKMQNSWMQNDHWSGQLS